MKKYNLIVILFVTIVTPFCASAYNITGRIIDETSKSPLHKAIFLARNSENKVVIGLEADQSGRFTSGNVSDSLLNIKVYHNERYDTLRMSLRGIPEGLIDIGDIHLRRTPVELDEVTVTASNGAIQTPDKYILYPSYKDLSQSASSINLLGNLQYSLPGLKVTESLNQVSVNGLAPVYMINGRKVSLSRILALNNSNIQHIEYYDNPQMRFGERPAINFVLKPRVDGGSFLANINSAVTTENLGGNIGITYYKGKSEWNINYDLSHRDYNDRRVSQTEHFIGGQATDITRAYNGQPGRFGYTNNNIVLDYTFKPTEQSLFSIDLSGNFYKQHLNDIAYLSQVYNGSIASSETSTYRFAKLTSPAIDLYFRQKFRSNHTLEVNAYSLYYDGDFSRLYSNGLENTNINTNTNNKSWCIGGELKYSIKFNSQTAYFGLSESYNHASNKLTEQGTFEDSRIGINNLFAYGQLSGRLTSKLAYNASLGLKVFLSYNDMVHNNAARAKGSLNLTYNVTQPVSISYMFIYDPSMPGVESQSTIVQSVSDFLLHTGNANIKPSTLLKNQVRAQYLGKNLISLLTIGYSRTLNPIYYDYTYIHNTSSPYHNKFLGRSENGRHNNAFCIEGELGYRNLFNHLNIGLVGGWCNYSLQRNNWNDSYSFGFGGINASFKISDFTLSTQYTIYPFYSLTGNTYSRPERWNSITAQYKYRNWFFRLTAINLFTKRGSLYHSWTSGSTYTSENWIDIHNCGNMIMLSATYRFNFGESMNKEKRSLKNGNIDSGLNMNL